MLQSFQHSDFATQFHKTYYLTLIQEIFAVMTGVYEHVARQVHDNKVYNTYIIHV